MNKSTISMELDDLLFLLRGQPRASDIEDFPRYLRMCARASMLMDLTYPSAEPQQPTVASVVAAPGISDYGQALSGELAPATSVLLDYLVLDWKVHCMPSVDKTKAVKFLRHYANITLQEGVDLITHGGLVRYLGVPLPDHLLSCVNFIEQAKSVGLTLVENRIGHAVWVTKLKGKQVDTWAHPPKHSQVLNCTMGVDAPPVFTLWINAQHGAEIMNMDYRMTHEQIVSLGHIPLPVMVWDGSTF